MGPFFKHLHLFRYGLVVLFFLVQNVYGQVCSTPGVDGPSGGLPPVNTYFPINGFFTLVPGTSQVTLDGIPPEDQFHNSYGSSEIKAGDLLLIVQIQGASMNSTESDNYGGNLSNGLAGTGFTNLNNVGNFEYIVALNSVPLTGGLLRFKGSGAGGGLVYSYVNAAAAATEGQKRFQIVRVPQFSTLTLINDVRCPSWNGVVGGIIAFDVAGTLDFNGRMVDASGAGFRGGYQSQQTTGDNTAIYRTTDITKASGKGEGVAGTPRWMFDGQNEIDQGSTWVGYPNGDFGRGAPGNAGGGGNDHNAGGGGGGNGGSGGRGGGGWGSGSTCDQQGGRGGSSIPATLGKLFLGGGGGGGDANNATSGVKGGPGGGAIFITANNFVGNGTIMSNGDPGQRGIFGSAPDGAGGGGAGGSIYLKANSNSIATLTLIANGGAGGNTERDGGDEHGPGGGGGGGAIFYCAPGANITTQVAGGVAGRADSGNGSPHGSQAGAAGTTSSFVPSSLPTHIQGTSSTCLPVLSVTMVRESANPSIAGNTAQYRVTLANNNGSSTGAAGGVRVKSLLPSGFSFKSATASYSGNASGPVTISNIGTASDVDLGAFTIPGGGTANILLTVDIASSVLPGTYNSSSYVYFLDPTRDGTNPTRLVSPIVNAKVGANTTYQSNSIGVGGTNYNGSVSINENVDVVASTNLSIEKNSNSSSPNVGGKITFSLKAINEGPSDATGITVSDLLPSGYTFVSDNGAGTYNAATGVWSVGSLARGASKSLDMVAVVKPQGVYVNRASILGTEADPTPSNNSTSLTPAPEPTVLSIVASKANALEPSTDGEFKLTLSKPLAADAIVNLAVSGNASAGSDYSAIATAITIPAGATEVVIPVSVQDDAVAEGNESVVLTISSVDNSNVTLGSASASVFIVDKDASLITVSDVTVNESANRATVSVRLSKAVQGGASVSYSTSNGTAVQPSDYTVTSGTLNFVGSAGEVKTFDIPISNDAVAEMAENLYVNLSNPLGNNVGVGDGQAVVTITDNDPAAFSINDVTVDEAASTASFTVSLNKAVQGGASVSFATADVTAVSASDYSASSGILYFNGIAGETKSIVVPIIRDDAEESSETFRVNLTNAVGSNVSIADAQGIGTITDNLSPIITSNGGGSVASLISIAENTTAVTTVVATDADVPAQALTYSIVGGADAAKFAINSSTGVLSFKVAPDFEDPTDVGANNRYNVQVAATDNGLGNLSDVQDIVIAITNVNEAPVITSNGGGDNAVVYVQTGTKNVTTVVATDSDLPAQTLTYSITAGTTDFTIDASTGALAFKIAPASPVTRSVTVKVMDNGTGNLFDTQVITVNAANTINVAPVITSNGGGATASITVNENTTAVTTVTATDAQSLTYSISGTDATKFSINSTTGVLVFKAAPDFENPTDVGTNNTYNLQVKVTDSGTGNLFDVQDIAVTVVNVNEAPTAVNDSKNTLEDTPAVINVISNDFDIDGTISVESVDLDPVAAGRQVSKNVSEGAWSVDEGGLVTFMPVTNFHGSVSLNYTVNDNGGVVSNAATVTVIVDAANDLPVLSNISKVINEDSDLPFDSDLFAGGYIDVDDNGSPVKSITKLKIVALPTNGTLLYDGGAVLANQEIEISNANKLLFRPDENWHGSTFIEWNGKDAEAYAALPARVNITVNPVNDAPAIDASDRTISENFVGVLFTPTVSDVDAGSTFTYSISGADASLFSISSAGAVRFNSSPDYESPLDQGRDNVYDIVVRATDNGGLFAEKAIKITVTNANESSTLSLGAISNASVSENTTYQSAAPSLTGTPHGTVVYSLSGEDAAQFTVDKTTGVVSMVGRDFESPADLDKNNEYKVTLIATDGDQNSASTSWTVTVTNINEVSALSLASISNETLSENTTYQSAAPSLTGTPHGAVVYSLSGEDAAQFTVDKTTGVVSMVGRDYESPADLGTNNEYKVTLIATDGDQNSASTSWTVTVTNANEVSALSLAPISNETLSENTSYQSAAPVLAGTPHGAVVYSLSGEDAAQFTVDKTTGVVSMVGRDYESPADANTNNEYKVTLIATDGDQNSTSTSWTVTVTNANEPSALSLGAISNTSVSENTTYQSAAPVLTGTPYGAVAYSLSGDDADKFTVDAVTGVVSMVGRDYESPADLDKNNEYKVTLVATDGDQNSASTSWTVTVTNINEPSALSLGAISNASLSENTSYQSAAPVLTGTPHGAVVYSLSGEDAAQFTVDKTTGVVSMVGRDYESPADLDKNNEYKVTLIATDGDQNSTSTSWTVTVTNANEPSALSLDAISNASVSENTSYQSAAPVLTGTPHGAVAYSLSGEDAAQFSVDKTTGVVSMVGRDYESPADANTNNEYKVTLIATDGDQNSASTSWTVTVTNANEVSALLLAPISNETLSENTSYQSAAPVLTGTAHGAVAYTLSGDDAAQFTVDKTTGVVSMVGRDYESPADLDKNNEYKVTLIATDGDLNSTSTSWTVTVTNANEVSALSLAPISNETVSENTSYQSAAPQLTGTVHGAVAYSLSGDDAAQFTVDKTTGVVSMVGRDYESPADLDKNNEYKVTLIATDGDQNSASTSWTVTVTNANEVSALSLAPISNASLSENTSYQSAAPSLTGTPHGAVVYSLSGDDAGLFTVDKTTGVVSMVGRDYESPADLGTNNEYKVTLIATDGDQNSASMSWTVTVTNANEPSALSLGAISNESVSENISYQSAAPVLTGTPHGAVAYSLSGDDAAQFTVDPATGVVSMVGRDYESPADLDKNNEYKVTLIATDGDQNSTSTSWTVTVINANEVSALSLAPISNASVSENTSYQSAAPVLTGTAHGAVVYSLSGDDAAQFTVDKTTGVVSMVGHDFESPADANTNNEYKVTLIATDGDQNSASTSWTVTVTNANESSALSLAPISNVSLSENTSYQSAAPQLTGTAHGAVAYSLSGDDAAQFTVDPATGVVSMVGRDFESPADLDKNSEYKVTLIATDGDQNSASTSWTVTVTNVNDVVPTATTKDVLVDEDKVITGSLLDCVSDADNDKLSFAIVPGQTSSNGVIEIKEDGNFTFTPNANFHGVEHFNFTVSDGITTITTVLSITVNSVNDAPVITDNRIATSADKEVSGRIVATDVDGDATKFSKSGDPSHGTVVFDEDGTYTYKPAAGYFGDDSFTIVVSDGNGADVATTIFVEVSKDITAPTAPTVVPVTNGDGTVSVSGKSEAGSTVTVTFPDGTTTTTVTGVDGSYGPVTSTLPQPSGDISVVSTDKGNNTSDKTVVSYKDVTAPTAPTVVTVTNGDGTVSVSGKSEAGSTVTVTFPDGTTTTTVTGVDGSYGPVTSTLPQPSGDISVVSTDKGNNTSDKTVVSYKDITAPTVPTVVPVTNGDGTVSVSGKSEAGSTVTVTFPDGTTTTTVTGVDGSYGPVTSTRPQTSGDVVGRSSDKAGNISGQTIVPIVIGSVVTNANAPVANNDEASTKGDNPVVIPVLTNDSDAEGALDLGSLTIINQPMNGVAVANPDGTVTYTAYKGFAGNDSFSYRICDLGSPKKCATAAVSVLVKPMDVKVPDAFSPNGDGTNDFFVIKGLESYPNNELKIFNRWGNVVFTMKGYDNSWDGKNGGKGLHIGTDLPDGTYYYILDLNDGSKPKASFIVIKR